MPGALSVVFCMRSILSKKRFTLKGGWGGDGVIFSSSAFLLISIAISRILRFSLTK